MAELQSQSGMLHMSKPAKFMSSTLRNGRGIFCHTYPDAFHGRNIGWYCGALNWLYIKESNFKMKILSCGLTAFPSLWRMFSSMRRVNSLYWRKKLRSRGWQYFVNLGGMIFVCKFNSLFAKGLAINMCLFDQTMNPAAEAMFRLQYFTYPGQYESCWRLTTGAAILFYVWRLVTL